MAQKPLRMPLPIAMLFYCGRGDTLAAIDQYGIADKISYISTGGGAFLEFLEGKTLPAVAVLEERANDA